MIIYIIYAISAIVTLLISYKAYKIIKTKRYARQVKKESEKELEDSKTPEAKTYESFEDFLMACPEYQIRDTPQDALKRRIMASFGTRFQQIVFIDKSAPTDHTVWLRREGLHFIHNAGTYIYPFKSEKSIIYYDIIDMRPLIDLTDEINWKDEDSCAEVVTALTNTKQMDTMRGNEEIPQYILVLGGIIVAVGIVVLITWAVGFDQGKSTLEAIQALNGTISK